MNRNNRWALIVGIVLCLAAIGITLSMAIIRKEGVRGLWNRKKGYIEAVHPETGPLLDEAERRAKDAKVVP